MELKLKFIFSTFMIQEEHVAELKLMHVFGS